MSSVSSLSFATPQQSSIPNDPPDIVIEPIEQEPAPTPNYCEELAGSCQQFEDGVAIIGALTSLAGIAYGQYTSNNILTGLFAVSTFCFSVNIAWNKTCGNLPRINRQFTQATERLQKLEDRQVRITQQLEIQTNLFKGITAKSREQIQQFHKLHEAEKVTQTQMQKNLVNLQSHTMELKLIVDQLKQALSQEEEIDKGLRSQIDQFHEKIVTLHSDVGKASEIMIDLKATEGTVEGLANSLKSRTEEIHQDIEKQLHQTDHCASLYEREIDLSKQLIEELGNVQKELKNSQTLNQSLAKENGELSQTLEIFTKGLQRMEDKMKVKMEELDETKKALDLLKKTYEGSAQSALTSLRSGSPLKQINLSLDSLMENTKAQLALLEREKKV